MPGMGRSGFAVATPEMTTGTGFKTITVYDTQEFWKAAKTGKTFDVTSMSPERTRYSVRVIPMDNAVTESTTLAVIVAVNGVDLPSAGRRLVELVKQPGCLLYVQPAK